MSLEDEARDADVSEGSRSPRTPPEHRVFAGWQGSGGALVARRGWRGARGTSQYSASVSGNGTPCSTRSTSSSSSLSPEYPPYRSRVNNVSPRMPSLIKCVAKNVATFAKLTEKENYVS